MTVTDWLAIIGGIATAIVLVINAIGTFWGRVEAKASQKDRDKLNAKADSADKKLDKIHELTNGNSEELKRQLKEAIAEIASLKETLRLRRRTDKQDK